MRVQDWAAFRQKITDNGWPVVLEGSSEHLKFLYLDTRQFIGHYLEYTWMTAQRWQQLGGH